MLNSMCNECLKLNHICKGDHGTLYTGCIFKAKGYTPELLRDAYTDYERKKALSDKIDNEFENMNVDNPGYGDLEKAWDEAYKAEYNAFIWCADIIQHLIQVDKKTARKMVSSGRVGATVKKLA